MSDGQVVIDIDGDDAGFRRKLGGLTKVATLGVAALTVATIGLGVAGVKAVTEFNTGMANVATLIPGNTERVKELSGAVQDMAVEVGKSTTDLSTGLYQTISAFGDTAETVEILETNARAAVGGLAETVDAINLTSAVTKAYGDTSAEAVEKVSDLALLTVRLGQTTFPELAASVGAVTPLMQALGGSQEELFATMATFTGVTGNASEVATQLKGTLQALMAPTDAAAEAFADAGYESGAAAVEALGFEGAIGLLTDAAAKSGTPLQDYIGSIEGQTLALALAGPQADAYRDKLAAMGDAAGVTDEAFREQAEGVNVLGFTFGQLQQVGTTSLQKLGDLIGDVFGPDLIASVDTVKGALDDIISGFGILLEGPAGTSKLGIMQGLVTDVTTGGEQIQAGISSLIDLLANGIEDVAPVLISAVASLLVAVAQALPGLIPPVVDALLAGILSIVNALPGIIPALIQAVVTALVSVVNAIITALPDFVIAMVDAIVASIPILIEGATQLFMTLAEAIPVVIPQVLDALIGGITQIVEMLPTLLPVVLEAAIALFVALAQALPIVQVTVQQAVVDLITIVVDMLPTLLPMLFDAAVALFIALVEALPEIMPQLTDATVELIIAIAKLLPTLIPTLQRASIALFTALVKAVPQISAALLAAFRELIQQSIDSFPGQMHKFEQAGRDIVRGLIDGITGNVRALKDAVTQAASDALEAAKAVLGIESPSKAFAWIGRMVDEGWADGITDHARRVVNAVSDTVGAMVDAAQSSRLASILAVSPGYVPAAAGYGLSGTSVVRGASPDVSAGASRGGDINVVVQNPMGTYADGLAAWRDIQGGVAWS